MNVWPCRAGTVATRRRVPTAIGPLALTVLTTLTALVAAAGCGGASSHQPSSGAPPATGAASAAGEPAAGSGGGPSGTLKLTGYYTYDGLFTGMFVCHYEKAGTFTLEGQEPYEIEIKVQKMREGTFVVHEQDPVTGVQKAEPGQPIIDVRGLDKVDGVSDTAILLQAGGTITFADGGERGTLSADYIAFLNNGSKDKVHADVHWTNCVH